jgi:hypothetical protein
MQESMKVSLFLKPIEITLFPWPLIVPYEKAHTVF